MTRARPLVLALAIVAAGALSPDGAAATDGAPRCFGAAARDDRAPCTNRKLRFKAIPSPRSAPLLPALECRFVRLRTPHVCAFGTSRRRAVARIALLGDSHAPAWRAAVDVLARSRRWRGLTLARSSCPFAVVPRRHVARDDAESCEAWVHGVVRWFRRHPGVGTVFLVNSGGYDFAGDAVAGYRAALDALPPSVRRIVVIRANPRTGPDTLPCVARALSERRSPDGCALPRETALPADPAAEAAPQLAGDRGRVVDLTRFFCGERLCFPVVGGALVFKDTSHITQVFSRTLGPYLLRDFRALRASAAPA